MSYDDDVGRGFDGACLVDGGKFERHPLTHGRFDDCDSARR